MADMADRLSDDRVFRWGLLGTARINRSLIPPLRSSQDNRLLAVASRDAARAVAYAREWGIERAHGSYEALLEDREIDAIYIPLPNHLHAEWAIKAAAAGKHVLCEKPLALSVGEVDAIEAAARKHGVVIAEAFMYRHHPQTLKVKQLVDEGAIGELRFVRGSFSFPLDNPGDCRLRPEWGGGSLWDVGCYPISFTRFLLGQEPVEVFGSQTKGPTGIDLTFAGQLVFANGVLAQIDSGFRSVVSGRAGGGRHEGRAARPPPVEAARGAADPARRGATRPRPFPSRRRTATCSRSRTWPRPPARGVRRESASPRAAATSRRSWRCCSRPASTDPCAWASCARGLDYGVATTVKVWHWSSWRGARFLSMSWTQSRGLVGSRRVDVVLAAVAAERPAIVPPAVALVVDREEEPVLLRVAGQAHVQVDRNGAVPVTVSFLAGGDVLKTGCGGWLPAGVGVGDGPLTLTSVGAARALRRGLDRERGRVGAGGGVGVQDVRVAAARAVAVAHGDRERALGA